MTPISKAAVALVIAAAAVPAQAQTPAPALALTAAKVYTDAAGAYVSVAVKNNGPAIAPEVFVSCTFFAGKRNLGTSTTTLFSIVPGVTGTDQVRLLGATGASRAECAITGQK